MYRYLYMYYLSVFEVCTIKHSCSEYEYLLKGPIS